MAFGGGNPFYTPPAIDPMDIFKLAMQQQAHEEDLALKREQQQMAWQQHRAQLDLMEEKAASERAYRETQAEDLRAKTEERKRVTMRERNMQPESQAREFMRLAGKPAEQAAPPSVQQLGRYNLERKSAQQAQDLFHALGQQGPWNAPSMPTNVELTPEAKDIANIAATNQPLFLAMLSDLQRKQGIDALDEYRKGQLGLGYARIKARGTGRGVSAKAAAKALKDDLDNFLKLDRAEQSAINAKKTGLREDPMNPGKLIPMSATDIAAIDRKLAEARAGKLDIARKDTFKSAYPGLSSKTMESEPTGKPKAASTELSREDESLIDMKAKEAANNPDVLKAILADSRIPDWMKSKITNQAHAYRSEIEASDRAANLRVQEQQQSARSRQGGG